MSHVFIPPVDLHYSCTAVTHAGTKKGCGGKNKGYVLKRLRPQRDNHPHPTPPPLTHVPRRRQRHLKTHGGEIKMYIRGEKREGERWGKKKKKESDHGCDANCWAGGPGGIRRGRRSRTNTPALALSPPASLLRLSLTSIKVAPLVKMFIPDCTIDERTNRNQQLRRRRRRC